MNKMNKMYKIIKRSVVISPTIRKTPDLNAEVYSQDIDVTKIVLELQSESGDPIDLTDAQVTVGLKIKGVIIEDVGQVENIEEQTISYCPGNRFKIQEGLMTIGFFVTLNTGQRIDIQNYKINFKRSMIDNATEEDVRPYFKSLDDIVNEAKRRLDEITINGVVKNGNADNTKLYYAYATSDFGSNFEKTDSYDPIYVIFYDYFGVSTKDSENPEDYFWFPTVKHVEKLKEELLYKFDEFKRQKQRHAPTGYTLDRSTLPWTIWFDNECGLRFPDYDNTETVYGYGWSSDSDSVDIRTYPLIGAIMQASKGLYTVDKFSKQPANTFIYWSPSTKVLNPINDATKFNFDKCWGEVAEPSRPPGAIWFVDDRKHNFARVMFELGIWSEKDILQLGATRK